MTPKNWPKDFIYLKEPISPEIHISILRACFSTGKAKDFKKISPPIEQKSVYPHLEMRIITKNLKYKGKKLHPLAKIKNPYGDFQRGIFATKNIPKDTELGEYVGEIYLKTSNRLIQKFKKTHTFGGYAWRIDYAKNNFLIIDGEKFANEMTFVNDYRGLQEKPNAAMKAIIHCGEKYFGYVTLRKILAGEEILTNYGSQYWSKQKKYKNNYYYK